MRGFATDYLSDYPGASDWDCVVDLQCGYSSELCRGYTISAWWSPSRKLVAFGGNWGDVEDMPASGRPSESQVDAWVRERPGFLQAMFDAAAARREAAKAAREEVQKFYDTYGCGRVYAEFEAPDGTTKILDEPCGIRGPMYMLPCATGWMAREMPPGSTLRKLTVSRRKPFHRGELQLPS